MILGWLFKKITWNFEYTEPEGTQNYIIEYTSNKVNDKLFLNIQRTFVKKFLDKDLAVLKEGESFVVPQEFIRAKNMSGLLNLPNPKLKKSVKFLTKQIDEIAYTRVKGGWVIHVVVTGIRRLY